MSVATHKIMMRLSLAISKLDICTSRWPQHRVNGGGCEMMVQGLHGCHSVTAFDKYLVVIFSKFFFLKKNIYVMGRVMWGKNHDPMGQWV
jgi:hypothetical protein